MSLSEPRTFGEIGTFHVPVALGLLRLTGDDRPDDIEAEALIHLALNQGVRLLDTADVYCPDQDSTHFGEFLVQRALRSWNGPVDEVRVLTKAGLTRVGRGWRPNGRPEHLRTTVQQSLSALGVEQIYLLQLHIRDPGVPFEDTLGTLADLQREGLVKHLGLCNTSVPELRQAQNHFEVASVQNELSVLNLSSARSGLLQETASQSIPFFAYRPFGGLQKKKKLSAEAVLTPLAERHNRSPHQIALATLLEVSDNIIPLFGATRPASVKSSIEATSVVLDASDQMALSFQYSFLPDTNQIGDAPPDLCASSVPDVAEDCGPGDSPEIVVLMGIQGAGKSEFVESYVAAGYARLNRDLIGGTLDGLVPMIEQHLADGQSRIVLDNTYPTRISRAPVIACGHRHGVPVRCRYLQTSMNDAHINIAKRMVAKYGMPLGPVEMNMFRKMDPTLPPPIALTKWAASFEPPSTDEGFAVVDRIPFKRRVDPEHKQKGLLLDVDGTLRKTRSGNFYPKHPDDVQLLPKRTKVLKKWHAAGYKLFFVSNQSGVASMQVSHDAVQSAFHRTQQLLGVPIEEIVYCPHPHRPVGCFCRKPMPGLGVYLMERHQLAPEHLVMVGDRETDEGFARAIGATYFDAHEFFRANGPELLD